jgi:hypothetical protein
LSFNRRLTHQRSLLLGIEMVYAKRFILDSRPSLQIPPPPLKKKGHLICMSVGTDAMQLNSGTDITSKQHEGYH